MLTGSLRSGYGIWGMLQDGVFAFVPAVDEKVELLVAIGLLYPVRPAVVDMFENGDSQVTGNDC